MRAAMMRVQVAGVGSGLGPLEGSQRLGKNSTRPFRDEIIGLVSQLSRRPFRP
jgi:hypothetical protein